MGFSVEKATLVYTFTNSACYGLFLCLYVISTVILLRGMNQRKRRLKVPLLAVTFGMFCFATLHAANNLYTVLSAFLNPQTPAAEYLSVLDNASAIISDVAYAAQTLLGDGFLFYRMLIVWDKDLLAAIPVALSYFGSIVTAFLLLPTLGTARSNDDHFSPRIKEETLAFYILTLSTNTMCTSLIAGKIWWIHRRVASSRIEQVTVGGRKVTSSMELIIESGAIYSIGMVIMIILYGSGSIAFLVVSNTMPSIIGITFLMIIVRLELGLSSYGDGGSSANLSSIHFQGLTSPSLGPSNHIPRGGFSRGAHAQVCLECGRLGAVAMTPLEILAHSTSADDGIPGEPNSSIHKSGISNLWGANQPGRDEDNL